VILALAAPGATTAELAGTAAGTALALAAGKVGVGTTPPEVAVEEAAAVVAVANVGWLCFCQALQSMISEKLKTKSRINRRLSITVSAVIQVRNTEKSGNRIIPARMPGMTTSDSPHGQPETPE
jgi:hypothetical protein